MKSRVLKAKNGFKVGLGSSIFQVNTFFNGPRKGPLAGEVSRLAAMWPPEGIPAARPVKPSLIGLTKDFSKPQTLQTDAAPALGTRCDGAVPSMQFGGGIL